MTAQDAFYYVAGLGFLSLAKAKHTLQGYKNPKPFDVSQTSRCVEYDARVCEEFVRYLGQYTGTDGREALRGKEVLELGPGSDLGVGLELLAQGAASYHACDVNPLVRSAPPALYDALFERFGKVYGGERAQAARDDLQQWQKQQRARLDYVSRDDFDIVAAFGRDAIDVVFSNAAFEHFDDIRKTIRDVTAVCRPGARLVVSIDLLTHSRWIREKDPNNIYRYPPALYRMFHFRGIPNRVRPYEYVDALKGEGWTDVRSIPVYSAPSTARVTTQFQDPRNEMDVHTVLICATRPPRG